MSRVDIHEAYMTRALELASRAWGQTHPNPMVGAVIVEEGKIMAEGWHHAVGQSHAEIEALNALGREPADKATLYVTLEPCSTCGRTGGCTDAIIRSGIKEVVVGATDPNPDHAGRGFQILSEAGIQVITGVLSEECIDLNLIFNHWIVDRSPLMVAKIATTLDGKFAASNGHSKWITGAEARADVMRWRRYFPGVAVSAQTVLADDPELTSRRGGETWCPRRFIFDRTLKTVSAIERLRVYNDKFSAQTTVVCNRNADTSQFEVKGIKVCKLPDLNGRIDLDAFRQYCMTEAIYGVYLEPGPTLATALIEKKTIDYLFHYIAPKYINDSASHGLGGRRETTSMEAAIHLQNSRYMNFGKDILVRGFL